MTARLSQEICPLCSSQPSQYIGFNDLLNRAYFKCPECALIFVPRQYHLSKTEEKKRYDQHNNDPNDPRYRHFLSKLTDPLKAYLEPAWQGLDYGCGPAPTIASLLEQEKVCVFNYDPYYYPHQALLGREYNFITCTEVAEHFSCPKEEFLKLNRLLKDTTSVLGVMTEIWQEEQAFEQWWYQKDPSHISFYQEKTFKWLSHWLTWDYQRVHQNVFLFHKKI